MQNNASLKGSRDNNAQADVLHYNSFRGEGWELFLANEDRQESYYVHRLFWKGSGFMHKHIHRDIDECIEVIEGKCAYIINEECYKACEGEIIHIPRGIPHVNPYNIGIEPLILVQLNPPAKLISFFRYYYKAFERELFALDERDRSKLKQMKSMNRLFSDTILFVNISKTDRWLNAVQKIVKKLNLKILLPQYSPMFS